MCYRAIRRGAAGAALWLAVAAASPAKGSTFIWDGGGGDNNWSTGANWVGLFAQIPPPDNGTADVKFPAASKLTSNVDMTWYIQSLEFTGGPYDLTGSQLTIGAGGITNNASATQEIFNNVVLSDHQTFNNTAQLLLFRGEISTGRIGLGGTDLTVTGAGSTAFRDIVRGNISITKTGTGILSFDNSIGPNTYTGSTTILDGTLGLHLAATVPGDLTIGNDSGAEATVFSNGNEKIGHDPGDVVLVRSTGHLSISGTETLDRLDITGGSVGATGTLTVNSSLNFLSPGGQVQGGSVFVGGDVLMNGSSLGSINSSGALTIAGHVTTVPSEATAQLYGNFRTYAFPAIFTVADGAAETDLQITGWYFFGGFTKVGAGTMTLAGNQANTFDDEVKVNEGVLVLAKPNGMIAVPGPLMIGDGVGGDGADVVRLEGNNQIGPTEAPDGRNRLMLIQSSGLLDLNGFNEILYHVSLPGSQIDTGGGVLTLMSGLGGFSSETMPARVSGRLNVAVGNQVFSALNGPLENDLILSAGVTIAPGASLTFAGEGQTVLTGDRPVSGAAYTVEGNLLLDKAGFDFAAQSGIHLKSNALVRLMRPEQIGSSSLVKIDGTATLDLNGHGEMIFDLVMSGGQVTTGAGALTVFGKVAYDATVPGGTTATISGNLNLSGQNPALFEIGDGPAGVDMDITAAIGNGSLRKTLGGTLRLSGNNSFSGGTLIEGGKVIIASDQALGGSFVNVTNATLQAEGSRNLLVPVTFGGTSSVEGSGALALLGATALTTLEKKGTGALMLGGAQFNNFGSLLHVMGGTVLMNTNGGSPAFPNLSIQATNPGSRLQLAATQNLASLVLEDGLAVLEAGRVIKTNALAIDASDAKLDLTRGDLIVQAAPGTKQAKLMELTAAIASARNTAPNLWQGFGITTSAATDITSLGIVLNDRGNGAPIYSTFAGQDVNGDSILIALTYIGDANLDGRVSIADYLRVDRAAARGLAGWQNGDFNYSGGPPNATDYFYLDQGFLLQGAPMSMDGPRTEAVPEPGTLGLLTPLLLVRRRRRRG